MNTTTYDEIFESFLLNCGYITSEIPQNEIIQKKMIEQSVKKYNSLAIKYGDRLQGELVADSNNETLNKKLEDLDLEVLSNIIAWRFAKYKLDEFVSVYSVVANQMGMKDYKNQLLGRKQSVQMYEDNYMSLITDSITSFDLE